MESYGDLAQVADELQAIGSDESQGLDGHTRTVGSGGLKAGPMVDP